MTAINNLFKRFCVLSLTLCTAGELWNPCIGLAPKYHGQPISAQSYDFCPLLAQLDNLDSSPANNGTVDRGIILM